MRPEGEKGEKVNDIKRVIAVDFDGVLSTYSSGWQGSASIPDPPTPGAIEWLRRMLDDERFEVVIFSGRACCYGGTDAMRGWLVKHGLEWEHVKHLSFPIEKPMASLFIDDRAWQFTGTFPAPDEILDFRPWHERGSDG